MKEVTENVLHKLWRKYYFQATLWFPEAYVTVFY